MTKCCNKLLTRIGLITILLIATALPITVFAESPKLNIKVSVLTEMVKAGETFEVTVSLFNYSDSAIQDIGGIQIDVPVDTEYLEYVDDSDNVLLKSETGDLISAAYNQSNNQYTFMYAYMNANDKALSRDNTDVVSLKFQLKKNIPEGKTFDITCKAAIATTDSPSKSIPTDVFFAQICSSDSASPKNDDPPAVGNNTMNPADGDNSADPKSNDKIVVAIEPSESIPWNNVTIDGSEIADKNLTTQQTDEGLIIRGDNLTDVVANITKNDQEASVKIETDKNEVLLKEDESGKVKAFIDSDGDGAFETSVAEAAFEQKNNLTLIIIVSIGISAIIVTVVILMFKKTKKRRSIRDMDID